MGDFQPQTLRLSAPHRSRRAAILPDNGIVDRFAGVTIHTIVVLRVTGCQMVRNITAGFCYNLAANRNDAIPNLFDTVPLQPDADLRNFT
jgi:uncharacterized membrane protein